MIFKRAADHRATHNPFCGEVISLLGRADYDGANIALAENIQATVPHFHRTFDEIYLALRGDFVLEFYDPASQKRWEQAVGPRELCVIPKGLHHVIRKASADNLLCVVTVPHFDSADETPSTVLG